MTIRQKLQAGEAVFGSLTLLHEPAIPELLGAIGYDFVILDSEHSLLDGASLLHLLRAAGSAGIAPLVRVRHLDQKDILAVLDAGAVGIVAPLVSSAADARRLSDFCRFPPEGSRTLCSATRAAEHGALRADLSGYFRRSNQEVVTAVLVESPEGAEAIDAIAAEDVDVVMVGRSDLSLKMGLGYQPAHPAVVAAAERVLARTIAAGKAAGVVAYSADEARRWLEFGCRFIVYTQPEMVLTEHYAGALRAMRSSRPSAPTETGRRLRD
jgi:2-keto-3-deoxy-L-rhamnonate aldolase RhmA